MKITPNLHLPDRFLGNYFCLIPNTRVAFIMIAKNASTFLKKVAMYNDHGLWPEQSDDAHYGIGFNEKSKYLIPVPSMSAFERKNGKYVKFAVWRNPVDRIVSTYKLFCLENEFRIYFQYGYNGLICATGLGLIAPLVSVQLCQHRRVVFGSFCAR